MSGFEPQGGSNWRWNGREWVDIRRERHFPWRWLGAAALVVVLALVAIFAFSALRNRGDSGGTIAASTPTPVARPAASPTPAATPAASSAPASAPGVDSVSLTRQGGSCQAGASCDVEVSVRFPLTSAPQDFAWTIQAVDACTGATTDLTSDHVTAQAGWNNVLGDRTVNLPAAKGALKLQAVTSSPARAASPALQIPGGAC